MATKYDFVSSEEKLRLAKTYKSGLWGLLNVDSMLEVVAPTWQIEPEFTRDHIIVKEPGGLGVVGHDGKYILEPRFHNIYPQTKDRIIVKTIVCFYGLFDGNGNELLPYIYQEMSYEADDCIIVRYNDLCGIVDVNGNVKLPYEYEKLSCYWPEKFILAKKNGKWGVFAYDLKELIPFEFDGINLYNNFIIVQKGKYKGLYDYNGKEIFAPTQYYYINPVNENVYIVSKDNKEGIISDTGKVIVDCLYSNIKDIGEECLAVQNELKNGKGKLEYKWGIVSYDGTLVSECKYGAVDQFVKGIAIIRIDRKLGCINKSGDVVLSTKWDYIIFEERDKYIKVGLRDRTTVKWGLFDTQGNQILPVIYDSIYVGEFSIDVEYEGKEGTVML